MTADIRRELHDRLARRVAGTLLFDPFSRGRYATDASIYQVEPLGVLVARSHDDVLAALEVAGELGVPVLPRGGGTSQCGQTVSGALVIDTSRHLNRVLALDAASRRVTVEPGIVLERLNSYLKAHGLFFPIDPSTANRATLGGMTGNNSCGARSIRYGNTVHNVHAIEAVMADGRTWRFGPLASTAIDTLEPGLRELVVRLRAIAEREAGELDAHWPKLLRHVGGYNLPALLGEDLNLARILVGSEGTLAYFKSIELDLQPVPAHRTLGVCHFPTFYDAMETTQHIVKLGPSAVEVMDRTIIDLARDIAAFRPIVDEFVRGEPGALLLVEFAGDETAEQEAALGRLEELMADRGFPGSVVPYTGAAGQRSVWEVRKAGMNIMMSLKGDRKPVSFIEDCAVGLGDLAEYTKRLGEVFARHGTSGMFYAHASVGCLHVRPILNMKDPDDVRRMRSIAEETFAMVKEYKGSHSGEHGDGIVRSEFHEFMLGPRIVRALEEIKDSFDPDGRFNPNRIVHPPRMDDRTLFRFKPGYAPQPLDTALDWSAWGGMDRAVEMCNNNGACRKRDAGVMCPSFRATGEEQHVTRGRANSLRLALTGQLGPDALLSPAMHDTMALCVSCKGCRRECPTGVDMARMKIEYLHQLRKREAPSLRERLVAYMPRYAPWAARLAPLVNLRNRVGVLRSLGERFLGLAASRTLPEWKARPYLAGAPAAAANGGRAVVLWVDTFTNYFEPENARAAQAVLEAAGYAVELARPPAGERPLCCGRTFLSAGLVEEARTEAQRVIAAFGPRVAQGVPVVALEPSCLLGLRDEYLALLPGEPTQALAAGAFLFEEFLAAEHAAGRLELKLKALPWRAARVHGHCHQKAFNTLKAVDTVLSLVPDLSVQHIESSCCGMAGAFGYQAEHLAVSMRMAELDLLPAVRAAGEDTVVVANGTSCRHQIHDGAGREAVHVARVLEAALA